MFYNFAIISNHIPNINSPNAELLMELFGKLTLLITIGVIWKINLIN